MASVSNSLHQAWRLYPDAVDVEGAPDLIDMLRRFAAVFSAEVQVGTQKGSFILMADVADEKDITPIQIDAVPGRPHHITASYFWQRKSATGPIRAALVVAIDLERYREMLKHPTDRRRWEK